MNNNFTNSSDIENNRTSDGDIINHIPRSPRIPRQPRTHEAVSTVLSTLGDQSNACADNFVKHEVKFKDLAALSREDLKLLGITDVQKQDEILETFMELPKQHPSFENIAKAEQSQEYNRRVFEKASSHLDSLNTALSATNLKLKINPAPDVVVEGKDYASKVVFDALEELKKITEDLEDRLNILEQAAVAPEPTSRSKGLLQIGSLVALVLTPLGYLLWRSMHRPIPVTPAYYY